MHRRKFLKLAAVSMVLPVPDVLGFAPGFEKRDSSQGGADRGAKNSLAPDHGVKDRLIKSRFFNHTFKDDILLSPNDFTLLNTSLARLTRIQKVIGYGNFSLLNFDDAVVYARSYSRI
jgi:hypothetical protein